MRQFGMTRHLPEQPPHYRIDVAAGQYAMAIETWNDRYMHNINASSHYPTKNIFLGTGTSLVNMFFVLWSHLQRLPLLQTLILSERPLKGMWRMELPCNRDCIRACRRGS